MPRVTSKDVARAAGVSQTTVSFVLNGRDEHKISGETRQHVVDTARRLGYVPSAAARSLRAGRSNVVVCLLPDLPVSDATEVTKQELSAALGRDGYTCLFLHTRGVDGELAEVWQHVDPAGVVSFGPVSADDAAALRSAGVPVLDDALRPGADRLVGLDQVEIGRVQVRHLVDRGHRHLAFAAVGDPRESRFCQPRIDGALEEAAALGLPTPAVAVVDYDPATTRAAVTSWSRGAPRVTGVAAFNDLVGLAVLGACRSLGLSVPDDVAVVGVDDLPAAHLVVPGLSTIAMDLSVPARNLAAQVLGLIRGQGTPDLDTTSRVLTLVRREST